MNRITASPLLPTGVPASVRLNTFTVGGFYTF